MHTELRDPINHCSTIVRKCQEAENHVTLKTVTGYYMGKFQVNIFLKLYVITTGLYYQK